MRQVPARKYDAPRRRSQAEQTRRSILEGARRLFVRSGMAETTVAAIAHEAGVSQQSVYAVFGSKAALLMALLDELERQVDSAEYAAAIETAADPWEQLALIVRFHCDLFEQGLDVIELARRSSSDPAVRRFVEEGDRRRRVACEGWVERWRARRVLAADLDARTAADLLWVHCGADLYSAFVLGCGWDRARVERWLVNTLGVLLFDPERRAAAP